MSGGRLLFCAPASGGGKTTITCGFLQALVNRGQVPVAFKSGPDYIDPMFHSQIIGAKSRNLDLFLMGEAGVLHSLAVNAGDGQIAVMEGAMGYYDGIAMSDEASAYHVATLTKTPAILVVDGSGRSLSVAPLIKGFMDFRKDSNIQGVVFNRISPMLYPRLKECVERELGIQVFGYLPQCPHCTLESRHLGLVTACEVATLKEKMMALAEQVEQTVDVDGLLALAATAPDLEAPMLTLPTPVEGKPKIAVAQDKAFCFYYEDALAMLAQLGAELVSVSPLHDSALPEGISGLYLGGGYPELYAKELSENQAMCTAIKEAIGGNIPTIAECGGFLYLHHTLEGMDGNCYPLCGVIEGNAFRTSKLGRFGYIHMTSQEDGLLCQKGEVLPAHEFHYWDSPCAGNDFSAQKPQSNRGWQCGHHTKFLYAGFPHCHLGANPATAQGFLQACCSHKEGLL